MHAVQKPTCDLSQDEGRAQHHELRAAMWMYFAVGGGAYALPLEYISKVIPIMSLCDVPGSACYVRGLMNIRGESIPVVDFAALAGIGRAEAYSLESPILLVDYQDERLGLLIGQVLGMEWLNPERFRLNHKLSAPDSLFTSTIDSDHGQALSVDALVLQDRARLITHRHDMK